jgi:hypothetical protein
MISSRKIIKHINFLVASMKFPDVLNCITEPPRYFSFFLLFLIISKLSDPSYDIRDRTLYYIQVTPTAVVDFLHFLLDFTKIRDV